jgi:hypothetical protein
MITNIVAYLLLGGLLALVGLIAAVIYDMRKKPPSTRKEVYVSPERVQAMKDAGVWDDSALRNRYLKAYQDYDNPKPAPPAPLPVNVHVTLDTPPAPPPLPINLRVKLETPPAPKNKGGRPKGSKNKKRLGRPKGSKTKIKKAIRSRA